MWLSIRNIKEKTGKEFRKHADKSGINQAVIFDSMWEVYKKSLVK